MRGWFFKHVEGNDVYKIRPVIWESENIIFPFLILKYVA